MNINNMLKRVHQSNSTIDKLYQISSIIQMISYICMEIHATFWRALRKNLWVQVSLSLYVHTLHLSSFFRISTFKKFSEIFYLKKSFNAYFSTFSSFHGWVGLGWSGVVVNYCDLRYDPWFQVYLLSCAYTHSLKHF